VRELPAGGIRPDSAHLAGLTFAAEQMVDRALQRAGNRIKTKYGLRDAPAKANRLYLHVDITAADCDDLLVDAWDTCHDFDYGVDPEKLARALDFYARALMIGRREPSRPSLETALKVMVGTKAA